MSGLYTRFMEWIMPFLETSCHYPVQRGAVGTDVKSMIEKENDHGTVWI